MDKEERAKLGTLLGYWIEHNKEHSQELREWAARAKGAGEPEAGEDILQAAQEMDKTNEILSRALKRVEQKER